MGGGKFINFVEIGGKFIGFVAIGGIYNMYHRFRGMGAPAGFFQVHGS